MLISYDSGLSRRIFYPDGLAAVRGSAATSGAIWNEKIGRDAIRCIEVGQNTLFAAFCVREAFATTIHMMSDRYEVVSCQTGQVRDRTSQSYAAYMADIEADTPHTSHEEDRRSPFMEDSAIGRESTSGLGEV